MFNAQSYRPFGTAAQYTVVPTGFAIDLPDNVSDQVGACLGIPGITAHRAVFGDGPVAGLAVLVHGVLGGVGSLAAQLAHWGGATVIGTVRRDEERDQVSTRGVAHTVAVDQPDPASAIRAHAPDGVDRIIEVAFSDNMTIRLLGSDDFPPEAKQQAAADLTAAARDAALSIPIGAPLPLEQAAQAHERVDTGTHARVLLAVPD